MMLLNLIAGLFFPRFREPVGQWRAMKLILEKAK